MMRSDLVCALVVGIVLILLVILSRRPYRGDKATPIVTKLPRTKRNPKPFAGLTRKPECPVCEQEAGGEPSASAPNAPPPRMIFTRGRRRHIDTTGHFCPQATCSYHGRVGWGNIRLFTSGYTAPVLPSQLPAGCSWTSSSASGGNTIRSIWEVGQLPLFTGLAPFHFLAALHHCAWYTLGDATLVICLYALGAWGHRTWGWGLRLHRLDWLWLPFAGMLVAIVMERLALDFGRWQYGPYMPLLSGLEVGIFPVLQMGLLPLLSVRLAGRLVPNVSRDVQGT